MAQRRQVAKQRAWTKQELRRLAALAKQKVSAAGAARTLRRSLDSTKKKASRLGLALGVTERWTADDVRRLKALAKKRRPVASIAKSLGRTIFATERAASVHRVSLDFRN